MYICIMYAVYYICHMYYVIIIPVPSPHHIEIKRTWMRHLAKDEIAKYLFVALQLPGLSW